MSLRPAAWRTALVAAAVLAPQGGRLHPESDAAGTVHVELAEMTADPTWVPSHSLLLSSAVLLAAGLLLALRSPAFASVRGALRLAAAAAVVSAVEMGVHLAAVTDSHHLAEGTTAPVATTHLALSLVVSPLLALAVVNLSVRLARAWSGARGLVAIPGILGAALHAVAAPVTLLLPDTETSGLFAAASLLLALWALCLAVAAPRVARPGAVAATTADERHPVVLG